MLAHKRCAQHRQPQQYAAQQYALPHREIRVKGLQSVQADRQAAAEDGRTRRDAPELQVRRRHTPRSTQHDTSRAKLSVCMRLTSS
jgi:hypothetical protein